MDLARLSALILACSGCGADPPASFVSAAGVRIDLNGHDGFLTPELVEEMDEYFLGAMPSAGYPEPELRRCLPQATVEVVGPDYRCYGGRPCGGEQLDATLIVVDVGCGYESAYLHELAHWSQQCVKAGYDPDHKERPVWQRVSAFARRCGP